MIFLIRHRRLLYRVLLLAVFVAIGVYVYANIEQIKAHPLQYEWKFVAISFLFTTLGQLTGYVLWMRIAVSFGMRTSWPHAGKAWFLSRLGRYIPGKISILLIRFDAYEGHSKTKVSAATIIEAFTSLCAVSFLFLLFAITSTSSVTPSTLSAALLVVVLLALPHPSVMKIILRCARRFLPIPPLDSLPRYRDSLGFVAIHLLSMLLHGGALFLAFNAIGFVHVEHYLLITSASFIAGLIGMLAVFAPSGIGVREGALFIMLSHVIDPGTLLVGAVLIRLAGVVSELLLSFFFIAYNGYIRTAVS